MRFKSLAAFALLVLVAVPAIAQDDYTEFTSKEDRFTITFPGKPVLSDGTWITEYGTILPAKLYTVNNITGRHVLTIVDYSPLERIAVEKSKRCPEGAEACQGVGSDTGLGYWKNDVRGAVTYGISKYLVDKDVKVSHLMFNFMQMVAGNEVQATNIKDGTRVSVAVYMHANKLFVAESTTPKGMPFEQVLQQSFGFLDEGGRGVRYAYLYWNEPDRRVPPPPVGRPGALPAGQAAPDRLEPATARP